MSGDEAAHPSQRARVSSYDSSTSQSQAYGRVKSESGELSESRRHIELDVREIRDGDEVGNDTGDFDVDADADADADADVDVDEHGHGSGEMSKKPIQKRRRVIRACDECRRKKIRCDGSQPCTHCSIYSYDCTYDRPSNRRRNPVPQYVEALESKLQRAETLLRKFMPDVDLNDPNLDPIVLQEFRDRDHARAQAQAQEQQTQEQQTQTAADSQTLGTRTLETTTTPATPATASLDDKDTEDKKITSMIESVGQLDLTEAGWHFHGTSSGAVFLGHMRENFQGLMGTDRSHPFLPRPSPAVGSLHLASMFPDADSPWHLGVLPPKEKAMTLCYYSLHCATCVMRFVHIPTFYANLDRLYERPRNTWGADEYRFMGLLNAAMALGCVYKVRDDGPSDSPPPYKRALEEAKHYLSARILLQDPADCNDMSSIQGLVFMILFLQATLNVTGCYTFLGIALRSAVRMGLHRHLPHAGINPIEEETRRRVFRTIWQLDIFVSAILGFPMTLHAEDVDQRLPTEVDDEYITKDGIIEPPPNAKTSVMAAFNANDRLLMIQAKVVKTLYPLKGTENRVISGEQPSMISYSKIKELERDLQEWQQKLPPHWRPGSDGDSQDARIRTLLRFSFANLQMVLYRPFLHYASPRLSAGKEIENRFFACAATCINVARNIVHICTELHRQSVLTGPYWFIIYTEFFAILTLVFYVVENPDKPGVTEILADATAGRGHLVAMARKSMAADRVTMALNSLFEQLPERLRKSQTSPAPNKKRSAPGTRRPAPSTSLPAYSAGEGPSQRRTEEPRPQRRTEEPRPQSGSVTSEVPTLSHSVSWDAMGKQWLLRQHQQQTPQPQPQSQPESQSQPQWAPVASGDAFSTQLRNLVPFEAVSAETSPESSASYGTASSAPSMTPRLHLQSRGHQSHGGFYLQTPDSSTNPLYETVDAAMFPPDDPFAYPTQPLADAAIPIPPAPFSMPGTEKAGLATTTTSPGRSCAAAAAAAAATTTTTTTTTGQVQTPNSPDTMQFYIPNLYHDIEGQVLSPPRPALPSYLPRVGGFGDSPAADSARLGLAGQQPSLAELPAAMFGPAAIFSFPQHQAASQQQQLQQLPHAVHVGSMDDFLIDPTTFPDEWRDILRSQGFR